LPRFKDWKPPTFDERGMTRWNWMCIHSENLEIGRNVDVGAFTLIQAAEGVILEDDVQIGGGCKIYSVDTIEDTRGQVVVRRGARVGANSVILPGVTIGEEAVVGALSLVKTDIPAREVWGGVPAHKIGFIVKEKRIPKK